MTKAALKGCAQGWVGGGGGSRGWDLIRLNQQKAMSLIEKADHFVNGKSDRRDRLLGVGMPHQITQQGRIVGS